MCALTPEEFRDMSGDRADGRGKETFPPRSQLRVFPGQAMIRVWLVESQDFESWEFLISGAMRS